MVELNNKLKLYEQTFNLNENYMFSYLVKKN